MNQAKTGNTVKINYEARLSNGEVLDTTYKENPLEFTLGEGRVIQGLEEAIVGMKEGESKTTLVSSEKAFGPHHKEKVVEMERKEVQGKLELEKGRQIQGRNEDGSLYFIEVKDVSESTVTLDTNHPLAGQDIIFDLKLVEIA